MRRLLGGGRMARRNGGAYGGKASTNLITLGAMFILVGAACIAGGLYQDAQYAAWLGSMSRYVKTSSNVELYLPIVAICMGLGVVSILMGLYNRKKEREVTEKMRGLTGDGVPAADFLAHRGALRQDDFTGVYVLHNKTKGMYYVGQSVRVIDRVGQHLTGHGNGDVYADFKYGDEFEVSTVSLAESGYGSLNDLERDTIAAHDAYNSGYNRTPGNAR